MSTLQSFYKKFSQISKIAGIAAALVTGFSTVAAAGLSLYHYSVSTHERLKAERIAQLTTYANFGDIIKRYRQIENQMDRFERVYAQKPVDCPQLIRKYSTGASVFRSDEFKDYAETIRFFEELGTLVEHDAVNFDIVFEIITFPSGFVTTMQPLSQCILKNWYGESKELTDFARNMHRLEKRYVERRIEERLAAQQ